MFPTASAGRMKGYASRTIRFNFLVLMRIPDMVGRIARQSGGSGPRRCSVQYQPSAARLLFGWMAGRRTKLAEGYYLVVSPQFVVAGRGSGYAKLRSMSDASQEAP